MSEEAAEQDGTQREAFIAEHTSALTDALTSIGIEDADWHDGSMLADALFCEGWRHKPWLSDVHHSTPRPDRHERGCAAGVTNGAARCQCAAPPTREGT